MRKEIVALKTVVFMHWMNRPKRNPIRTEIADLKKFIITEIIGLRKYVHATWNIYELKNQMNDVKQKSLSAFIHEALSDPNDMQMVNYEGNDG